MRKLPRFNNLAKYLFESGMSDKEFCIKTGISKSTMSRYLNAKTIPNVADAIVMAKTLNLSVEDLYGRPFVSKMF